MKKGEIIAIIRQKFGGGITDRTFGIKANKRVIARYCDLARRDIILEELGVSGLTDQYIKRFFPYLLWDGRGGYAYVPLPASMMNLPNDAGLRFIAGRDINDRWEDISWDIVPNDAWQVYSRMESAQTHQGQLAYIEGGRIVCPRVREEQANTCVQVRIVPESDGYTDEEEYPIPIRAGAFMDRVGMLMHELKVTPSKTGNDGNPDSK